MTQSTDNCNFGTFHCYLTLSFRESPTNIRMNCVLLETRIPELRYWCIAYSIGLSFLAFAKHMYNAIEYLTAI